MKEIKRQKKNARYFGKFKIVKYKNVWSITYFFVTGKVPEFQLITPTLRESKWRNLIIGQEYFHKKILLIE